MQMSVQAPVVSRTRLQRISRVIHGFRLDERVFDEEVRIMEELDERRLESLDDGLCRGWLLRPTARRRFLALTTSLHGKTSNCSGIPVIQARENLQVVFFLSTDTFRSKKAAVGTKRYRAKPCVAAPFDSHRRP